MKRPMPAMTYWDGERYVEPTDPGWSVRAYRASSRALARLQPHTPKPKPKRSRKDSRQLKLGRLGESA